MIDWTSGSADQTQGGYVQWKPVCYTSSARSFADLNKAKHYKLHVVNNTREMVPEKTIAFAFSNVSLPPFIPFIVLASFILGNFILGQNETFNISTITTDIEVLKHLKIYIIGSFALATVSAILTGMVSYIILFIIQKKKVRVSNA